LACAGFPPVVLLADSGVFYADVEQESRKRVRVVEVRGRVGALAGCMLRVVPSVFVHLLKACLCRFFVWCLFLQVK